jgi:uncharacterized membrane protein
LKSFAPDAEEENTTLRMLQKQPGYVCILFAENISGMPVKLELGKKLQSTATLIYSTPNTTVPFSEKCIICSCPCSPYTTTCFTENQKHA